MKILAISDSHMRHRDLELPLTDVIIHAGDVSSTGAIAEILDFLDWFSALPHPYKIFIAGNHDFAFERNNDELRALVPANVIYLENCGVDIEGIYIWGSPVQPTFYNWAFNVDRGADIKKYWDLIPSHTQILITHGPPMEILDRTVRYKNVGCEELKIAVERIKPNYHIFGHIHEAYGNWNNGFTEFINASVLNEKYIYTNDPIVFEI